MICLAANQKVAISDKNQDLLSPKLFCCIINQTCVGPGAFDLVGDVRLYISHWPCISCIAVLCQVLALAPAVPVLTSSSFFVVNL